MITVAESTEADIPRLSGWIAADPYHFHLGRPEWWLSQAEGSLFAFRLDDDMGPLTYVRLEAEGELVRIHMQFAPESEVSKRRLVAGIVHGLKAVSDFVEKAGAKGFIFNSVSPRLIAFLTRFGFKSVGSDDYQLTFEGN